VWRNDGRIRRRYSRPCRHQKESPSANLFCVGLRVTLEARGRVVFDPPPLSNEADSRDKPEAFPAVFPAFGEEPSEFVSLVRLMARRGLRGESKKPISAKPFKASERSAARLAH
jgi:hypothetical protein